MMDDPHSRSNPNPLRSPRLGWRGGILQLIFFTILPLTALLLAITFGSITIHQRAMRTMVGERDARAVRTAAAALRAQVEKRISMLEGLSMQMASDDAGSPGAVLAQSSYLLSDFEGGLAVFDAGGSVVAASGDSAWWQSVAARREDLIGQNSPFTLHVTKGQEKLLVVTSGGGSQAEGLRVLGAFSPARLVQSTLQDAYGDHQEVQVRLLDREGQLLFYSGSPLPDTRGVDQPGAAEALAGQSGTRFLPAEDGEHVVAYAPVEPAGWALIVEEPWEMVADPLLSYSQMAPLVLVPVLLLTLFALWIGIRQIIQPLQILEEQADALAWGDYQAVEKPVGGITEIRRLQTGLIHMAQQVRAAQQSLHGYIGAITAGQEEERRRLARELHDDTIQSLIALKQRVQLAQMDPSNGSRRQSYAELEELTEKTIGNLRRVTRDLRPVYLEDLGLLAALEMLSREVTQTTGVQVDFESSGHEQRLPPGVELALYRITQEALSNIARHAGAQQAWVRIRFDTDHVFLEVADNGRGFEVPRSPAEFAPSGHYGLLGLFERAELIGARLRIQSTPGEGTSISVKLDFQVVEETSRGERR